MFPSVADLTIDENGKLSYLFENGDFVFADGKVCFSNDFQHLTLWIDKILVTKKNYYEIYSQHYGADLLDTLNLPYDFVKEELKRQLSEALLKNTSIISITNFSFSRLNRGLLCAFTVNTVFGSFDKEV